MNPETPTTPADEPEPKKNRRRGSWKRRLLIGAAGLAGFLLIVKLDGCAERLFFYPIRDTYAPPPRGEDVRFTSEGRSLHGWFLPALDENGEPKTGPSPTIVHCHGNAFNISRHVDFVEFLPNAGFNVLIFDYRSYGMSDKGPLHRDGLINDAVNAIAYARARPDVDPDRLAVYGLSLGGTIGLAAAAEDADVDAVLSVATFSTWERVAGDFAPALGPWLVPPGRDAVDSVTRLGCPLLIIHGTDDNIVRHYHAPIIHRAALDAGVDAEFQSYDGVAHVDWIDQDPEIRGAIVEFFRRTLDAPDDTPEDG